VKPKSAANADLRYEHAKKKRGPLTALRSAYNLFGDSFFDVTSAKWHKADIDFEAEHVGSLG
jgi:hypothetical protein